MFFGHYVKHIMLDKGITIKELASRMGVSNSNVSYMLKDGNVTERRMRDVANALGMELVIKLVDKTDGQKEDA